MKNFRTLRKTITGTFLQTSAFALTLLCACYFWDAPNAGLLIGTGWPIFVPVFGILSLLQNWIIQNSKSGFQWFVSIVFFLLLSVFFFYPDWSFILMVAVSALIVLIPLYCKPRLCRLEP